MKAHDYLLILLLVTACSKKKEETPAPASQTTSGYHLERKLVWGNPTTYNSNDKVLSFDTVSKIVAITGSATVFYTNGNYPYRIFDTTVYIPNPRGGNPIAQDLKLLSIQGFKADRINVYEYNAQHLKVVVDYILGIADEEETYYFEFR